MFKNKTFRTIFFIVVIAMAGSYFAGLSIDVTRDAGKYATVAKEVFQNGNYINLTVHGEPYDQKPPLLFWLGAAGFSMGGISNFWFKFPVLLLIFLGFYWAFRLGESLYNKRVGYLTALMLGFSFIYSLYSADIHTDTPLQAFVTLALWQLFEFIKTRKEIHWILGFVGVGLAILSKGPIGAAIPAFAVVGHILLKKDFKFLLDYRWYAGVVLAFAVASPALIGLMNQFGWEGIRFFFWDNNVGRITGSYVKAINDPFFYLHSLLYLFLPWSILFFMAVFYEFRQLVRDRFRTGEYFTFTGIWIYFIILNSASSQLPNYIFSIVPLIAVLTAKWIDIAATANGRVFRVFYAAQNGVTGLLWALIFALVLYLFPQSGTFNWFFIAIGLSTTLYIFLRVKNELARLVLPSLVVFTCLTLILNTGVLPYMFSFQAPPKAARYFNEQARQGDKLYNYKYGQYELYFYSEPQATRIDTIVDVPGIAHRKGSWIFTDRAGFAQIDSLQIEPDTIIAYKHLYLNRSGKFINPKTRDAVLQPMYLIKY